MQSALLACNDSRGVHSHFSTRIGSAEATWLRRRMRFNLSTCQTWKKLWVKLEKMVCKCFLDVQSFKPCWVKLIDESRIHMVHVSGESLRTVIHHPFRLENFMKEVGWIDEGFLAVDVTHLRASSLAFQEEVEEGDYDVKLRTADGKGLQMSTFFSLVDTCRKRSVGCLTSGELLEFPQV